MDRRIPKSYGQPVNVVVFSSCNILGWLPAGNKNPAAEVSYMWTLRILVDEKACHVEVEVDVVVVVCPMSV